MNIISKLRNYVSVNRPKSYWGKLAQTTFTAILMFAVSSFFSLAGFLIMVATIVIAWRSVRDTFATLEYDRAYDKQSFSNYLKKLKPRITAILPVAISSVVLQAMYYGPLLDVIALPIAIGLILLNLIPLVFLAWLTASIFIWIRESKEKKKRKADLDKEQKRSEFAKNIQRLGAIVLVAFCLTHIGVPTVYAGAGVGNILASSTLASNKQTSDELIQNFDSEKKYKPAPVEVVPDPPGYEKSGADNKTKELENYPEAEQKAVEKKSAQKVKTLANEKHTYKELEKLHATGKISEIEMQQLVEAGRKKGNISAWDKLIFYASGILTTVKKTVEVVVKPFVDVAKTVGTALTNTWNYVKAHPVKAFLIAVTTVVTVVVAVVFFPVAVATVIAAAATFLVWTASAIAVTYAVLTIGKIGYKTLTGGSNGFKQAIFSKETTIALKKGEISQAIGSGAGDVINTVLTIIPVMPLLKVASEIKNIGSVAKAVEPSILALKNLKDIVSTVSTLKNGANAGTVTIINQIVWKLIAGNPKEKMQTMKFLTELKNNQNAASTLRSLGNQISQYSANKADRIAFAKNVLEDVFGKGISRTQTLNFVREIRSIPQQVADAVKKGTLGRPGPNNKYTYKQLAMIEDINAPRAHGILKHVEKSWEYLVKRTLPRALGGENTPAASSFTSKEKYVEHVNKALDNNYRKIEAWLKSNSRSNLELDLVTDNKIIGQTVQRDVTDRVNLAKSSKIILRKNANGYYINTNFVQ